jgi:autotransporter strand-loop-strand O-heptosyltransferase
MGIKVRAHTCYIGKTGYASHARGFFRELSKWVSLRIRNYTWDNNPDYLSDIDINLVDTITLKNSDGSESDYPMSFGYPQYNWTSGDFNQDIDIVLMEVGHHYFYQEYTSKIKIAYTVWESTELPQDFFNRLFYFDYLWVVSDWHKECVIKQGYPQNRVFVVNEGVSGDFYPIQKPKDDIFNFMVFGRWDYRKSIPEIIQSFLDAFPDNPNVRLKLGVDNPFSIDGLGSTGERLEKWGFSDSRIDVLEFLNYSEYRKYMMEGHVLITCARSEGWNIPLIEAMASGTPVIYSNWGAQLEFTKGEGNPVQIKEILPASIGKELGYSGDIPGFYSEPDYSDLSRVILDCYNNWEEKLGESIRISQRIRRDYNWGVVGEMGIFVIKKILSMENLNELVVIMSHADTPEKLSLLEKSCLSIKGMGYRVCLSSHIDVPSNISELFDVVIIDRDNPIIYSKDYHKYSEMSPIFYIEHPKYSLKYTFDYNHGLSALRLIRNGLGFSKINRCGVTHFINYDYIINDSNLLGNHSREIIDGFDLISYKWNSDRDYNTGIFSCKTDSLYNVLSDIFSEDDYFGVGGSCVLEDIFWTLCDREEINVKVGNIDDIREGNLINQFILPTFPKIITPTGNEHFIFLSKIDRDYYVSFVGSKGEELNIEIKWGGDIWNFSTDHIMKFIKIPNTFLDSGFYVNGDYYNQDSKTADIEIKDWNLVLDLYHNDVIEVNFKNGPYVEIRGFSGDLYNLKFIDRNSNKIIYEDTIKSNHWAKSSIRYFIDWEIIIRNLTTGDEWTYHLDLKDKNVFIQIDSSALGDTLAWFPYIEDFGKKHGCNLYVSTFNNNLFTNQYSTINLVSPGDQVEDIYVNYIIGWYYKDGVPNSDFNPIDFRKQPMQKTASDILGLEYRQLKPRISLSNDERPISHKYVTLGIHATAQAKYWNNPTGWQEITDYFIKIGWGVVVLSNEGDGYMGNNYPDGIIEIGDNRTLGESINYLKHSEMFIGVGSGLSWLSWAVGIPTVIISGWSLPYTEFFDENVIRIFKGGVCNGCFNRTKLDQGDWNFCPDNKGTNKQFECSKLITGRSVIDEIEKFLKNGFSEKTLEVIIQESYDLGMVQNHKEIFKASNFFKNLDVINFMEIGTDQGGTFAIWSKLAKKDGIRISVDLPHGEFGRSNYNLLKRDNYLKSLGDNVHIIHGNSHNKEIKERVNNILGENKVDFLFIDGDHTYEGVKQDYEMYKEFVKVGGWIGFHDIKSTDFHHSVNCMVDKFWNEINCNKIEFLDKNSEYGGIGLIKVD